MRMCTVATTPHMRIDAMKVAAAVLRASNRRESVSLFANYSGPSLIRIAWDQSPFRISECYCCYVCDSNCTLSPLCFRFLGIPAFAAHSQNTQHCTQTIF